MTSCMRSKGGSCCRGNTVIIFHIVGTILADGGVGACTFVTTGAANLLAIVSILHAIMVSIVVVLCMVM